MVAERQKVGKLNGIAIPLISDSKAVRLVLVTKCSYQPAEPDVRYLPNGDPGYPGCAADVEIEEVHFLHKRKDKRIKARLIEPDYKSHCWNQLHDGLMEYFCEAAKEYYDARNETVVYIPKSK